VRNVQDLLILLLVLLRSLTKLAPWPDCVTYLAGTLMERLHRGV